MSLQLRTSTADEILSNPGCLLHLNEHWVDVPDVPQKERRATPTHSIHVVVIILLLLAGVGAGYFATGMYVA